MALKRQVQATLPAKKDKDGKFLPNREKDQVAVVTITDGETAAEQVKLFGDEAVKSNASSNWDVTIQAAIRRGLNTGKTQAQIQEELKDAKMGVKMSGGRVDTLNAFLAGFASATPEDQAKMVADLKKKAAALAK
uniref:Uncharacterized protein n=2 Tax=viral metagenome TaxID=1070528 RepID=A0A6M3KY89_9ZZZZ